MPEIFGPYAEKAETLHSKLYSLFEQELETINLDDVRSRRSMEKFMRKASQERGVVTPPERQAEIRQDKKKAEIDIQKGKENFKRLLNNSLDELAAGNTQAPRALYRIAHRAYGATQSERDLSEDFAENEHFTYQWLTPEILKAWDAALTSLKY